MLEEKHLDMDIRNKSYLSSKNRKKIENIVNQGAIKEDTVHMDEAMV